MLSITTATTLTNPNETNSRFIEIKLHNTGQIIKQAIYGNPLTLDQREQRPNIKIGTEVLVMVDDLFNFYVMLSIAQGIDLVGSKIYRIENSDEVRIMTDKLFKIIDIDNGGKVDKFIADTKETELNSDNMTINTKEKTIINTDKFKVKNSSGEVIALMLEFIDIMNDQIIVGNMGIDATLKPVTKSLLDDLKSRLQTFKL